MTAKRWSAAGWAIPPIVTQEREINTALEAYWQGSLEDHPEMLD